MRWLWRSYPALFVMYPVLALAAARPGYYRSDDALALCLVGVLTVLAGYAASYVALREWMSAPTAGDVAALVTACGVELFYTYPRLVTASSWSATHAGIAAAAGASLVVALLWMVRCGVHRYLPRLGTIGPFFTIVGALLVAWSAGKIVGDAAIATLELRRSALVRELERPVSVIAANAPADPAARRKRDIFLIVLDEYASSVVLRERFGIDNRPFEDSLRALGFSIPSSVRSNYANTLMSISSLLNFAHVKPLADVVNEGSVDYGPAAYLLEHNRAERFLKSEGYRFVFFPSPSYPPTRDNDDADVVFSADTTFDLAHLIYRSDLRTYLAQRTLMERMLPLLPSEETVRASYAAATLAGLRVLGADETGRPTFVIAHVLMPHTPFVVDASCQPIAKATDGSLADELHCLNRETLQTVRALQARSGPPPIIIVTGDHGTQSLHPFESDTAVPTEAQARERFRAFGAYYLPDGGAAAMPDSLSLVNVLRYVFSYYFGADLPPLPNTMFFSHWKVPYRLTELSDDFQVRRLSNVSQYSAVAR